MSCNVAFIGLGVMGYPMAGYISKAGHNVTVYNRTAAKADKWIAEHKGSKADTPAKAAEGADYVFTCVGNDNDLREVTFGNNGAFKTIKKGAIYIDNTTASAEIAIKLYKSSKAHGWGFLDAPVSGGQAGAENGALTVMIGGDKEDFEKAGMKATGTNPETGLVEIVEIPSHPWFVGVQYHPEYKSTVANPHPLFEAFVDAAITHKKK